MPKTILIADDDAEEVRRLSEALTGAGYAVVTAATGAEALAKAPTARPGLFVIARKLPDMDGRALVRALRSVEALNRVPVVMIRLRWQFLDFFRATGLGVAGHLARPVDLQRLATFARSAIPGRPRTILVVDSSERYRRLIEFWLLRKGHRVITAATGAEAINRVHSEVTDLIILATILSDIDRFEVVRALKSDGAVRMVPLILTKADWRDADVFRGYQFSVDCFLTKPINSDELLSFVKRIFDSQDSTGSSDRYQF